MKHLAWPSKFAVFGTLVLLYLPILNLIVFSFNASRLTTIWGGFSLEWYIKLFQNEQLIGAALLSIKIAVISATIATVLGTMIGLALVQVRAFRGRTLFGGLASAPLVMPEVITGLSLLLLFVSLEQAIGWPQGRGVITIVIAHSTLTCAFVAVIVQARLVSMDESLVEAALDLGSRPHQVTFDITLPLILPGVISGWLLAFTLSLDDLVLASFTSGPGASTLPMVIFSKIRLGVTPDVNALATLIILFVTILLLLANLLTFRRK